MVIFTVQCVTYWQSLGFFSECRSVKYCCWIGPELFRAICDWRNECNLLREFQFVWTIIFTKLSSLYQFSMVWRLRMRRGKSRVFIAGVFSIYRVNIVDKSLVWLATYPHHLFSAQGTYGIGVTRRAKINSKNRVLWVNFWFLIKIE